MERRLIMWILITAMMFVGTTYAETIVGKTPHIRLLCIKHSREYIADGDANLAIGAAFDAKEKGLNIQVIGNHFVDESMMVNDMQIDYVQHIYNKESLTNYLHTYVKAKSTPGDTLIIFTIGHGFQDGTLQNLGQREEVMKIIAQIAETYNQKIFWWQLSCYASAKLPSINSLNTKQKELMSMFASSDAYHQSYTNIQGNIMRKLFLAMTSGNIILDPNKDGQITNNDLKQFMNTIDSSYGSRIHAVNSSYIVFGKFRVPYLPIVDRNNPQGKYGYNYVMSPYSE